MTRTLQNELKAIIRKMKKIQKAISADDQPVSRHELEALRKLGQRYADVIGQLESGLD